MIILHDSIDSIGKESINGILRTNGGDYHYTSESADVKCLGDSITNKESVAIMVDTIIMVEDSKLHYQDKAKVLHRAFNNAMIFEHAITSDSK